MSTSDEIQELLGVVQRRVEKFGWVRDLPDRRDFTFDAVQPETSVPPKHDLWNEWMPSCFDQLQLGSCTGNGWVRVMMRALWAAMQKDPSKVPMLSRLFVYYLERYLDGTVNQDSGAQIRDGAKVVSKWGVPPESDYPYDISRFTDKPTSQAFADALKVEALQYKRIPYGLPGAPIRSAISQGYPIVFGFPVPDYFEDQSRWDPASQALPVPGNDVNWIGGHCVVASGYDFTKTKYPVPVILCDNSWGTDWGQNGRFAMDSRWFKTDDSLASDLWIVQKVS